jgi:hypothetical protein
MLEGIDHVDWAGLSHALGGAADVPAFLRQLLASPDRAREALVARLGRGGDAAAAAIPFLIELLAAPRSTTCAATLTLLVDIDLDSPALDSALTASNAPTRWTAAVLMIMRRGPRAPVAAAMILVDDLVAEKRA